MNISKSLSSTSCNSYVVLYAEYGYGHGSTYTHGGSGIIASDCNTWNVKSFEKQGTATIYVTSGFDISLPTQNHQGYMSDYDPDCSGNLLTHYAFPSYPLNFYCIDKALVTPVFISLACTERYFGTVALAATSSIPYSSTLFSGLTVANGVIGNLGFIDDHTPGSTLDVTLKIGSMDKSTGLISWQTDASMTLTWDGLSLSVSASTLPTTLSTVDIVRQDDGTWMINILPNDFGANNILSQFDEKNFCGVGGTTEVDDAPAIYSKATNCSEWRFKSFGIFPEMPTANFFISSYFEVPTLDYSFKNYNIVNSKKNISDTEALFSDGTLPARINWIDDDKYPTWLKLETNSAEYSAIIIECVRTGDCYFTSKIKNGYLCDITTQQSLGSPLIISYGSLDANGIFIQAGQGQLVVSFVENSPVVIASELPASLTFSSSVKQADNTWLVTLSETVV